MCKILTIIIGLFIYGCVESEPIPESVSSSEDNLDNNKSSLINKKYNSSGCKLLASGYLLCPKVRR